MTPEEVGYLIGAYIAVADKEINAFECREMESQFPDLPDDTHHQCRMIFSDNEDKPSLESLLGYLGGFSFADNENLLVRLCHIALADGYVGREKLELLQTVAARCGFGTDKCYQLLKKTEDKLKEVEDSNKLTWQNVIQGAFESVMFEWARLEGENSDEDLSELLSGVGFSRKIEEITSDAVTDLSITEKMLHDTIANLKGVSENVSILASKLKTRKRESDKERVQIYETIESLQSRLNEDIKSVLSTVAATLEKKRHNIKYFTIAFMGRTKAGKSTLHKVVTHQEDDDIGIGKVRTTRFNRSWYWEKLRIIDTPGIGAPGGASDTEIARTIIDEADLICYLVTDNSIQQTEFDFLGSIKERNKPLFIVLNVKSAIDNESRLKRFLKNPTSWMTDTGNKSIAGHFERIKEALEGKYNMDAVKIIPLHLLAALIYHDKKQENPEIARLLLKGSNIERFVSEIKATVYNSGSLKKSMSVIGSCAYHLHQSFTSLDSEYRNLHEQLQSLKKKKREIESFFKSETERLKKDILTIFSNAEADLKNRADAFADVEYDNKDAGEQWGKDSEVNQIQTALSTALEHRVNDFLNKLKERLEEIVADLKFQSRFDNSYQTISGESITNWKFIYNITSAVGMATLALVVACNWWNPGGWILAGIGIAATLLSGLFTSKEKKIKKAKDKIRSALYENIDKNIKESCETTINNIRENLLKINIQIADVLGVFLEETSHVLAEIRAGADFCQRSENALNSLEALRILEFLQIVKVDKCDATTIFAEKHCSAEMDWANQRLIIKTNVDCDGSLEALASEVTQMDIKIKS